MIFCSASDGRKYSGASPYSRLFIALLKNRANILNENWLKNATL